ncbi:MAG: YeeE/YedE family protein [Thermodesulfobacteriota bacterium]|nr:YeeE/YedE family protein [Thermodesulfobacteriota bacterium]
MSSAEKPFEWRAYAILSVLVLLAVTAAAVMTRLWVLTAIPVGFLFGFFLKKGELCGASAFSEVILFRDRGKMIGLWTAIVVAMAGFAVIDLLGWVQLNPKPMTWLSYIVGGLLFGTGMVLAGGCVSGCLFKAGAGNLNAMAGVVGIPLGIALVEYGPLHSLHVYMKGFVLKSAAGGPVTFSSLTGLPFWGLAGLFGLLTLLFVYFNDRHKKNPQSKTLSKQDRKTLLTRPWKPWQAGLAIGLLSILAYLSSAAAGRNYPLGVTHGVLHVQLLMTESDLNVVWHRNAPQTITAPNALESAGKNRSNPKPGPDKGYPRKKVVLWLVGLVCSLVAGSWMAAKLSGNLKVLPKPPGQVMLAFMGGLLVGTGAAFAKGCVIGNILSGWALMSVGTVLFGVVTILANWATTYFYLMGGTVSELFE